MSSVCGSRLCTTGRSSVVENVRMIDAGGNGNACGPSAMRRVVGQRERGVSGT
jgi:hypothetical protein